MLLSIDVGIRNLGMCLMNRETKQIIQWCADGVPPLHSDGLFKSILNHMRDRPWVLDATKVLIERQPDKNLTMKSVEHFLHSYFLIHGKDVQLWDARHKVPDVSGPGRAMYIRRKKVSVERCTEFITQHNPEKLEWFMAQSKKDDLADTVMQALSYEPPPPDSEKKRKLVPRKPTLNQLETRYSRSNLLWIYLHGEKDQRFYKDLARYYKDIKDMLCEQGLECGECGGTAL